MPAKSTNPTDPMISSAFGSSLENIMLLRSFKRKRESSYDRTGGNLDSIYLEPGEKRVVFDKDGPGSIMHIWSTQNGQGVKNFLRGLIIRIWWDDEIEPSVECPLSDFFGMGHAMTRNFVSEPLQMSPTWGRGMNSWWPMPFRIHAKIELENDNPAGTVRNPKKKPENEGKKNGGIVVYFYFDYEIYDKFPEDPSGKNPVGYFHVQFRRRDYKTDMKKDPDTGKKYSPMEFQVSGGHNTRENGGYERNHIILQAKGKGHYVGCHLNIDNRTRLNINWPGEGDDMIFIDDDVGGEPTLYGTGTEDYVNTAWSPWTKYSAPYHGVIKTGGFNYYRKITYYRYHIRDPISYEKEIKVTIEHGHNNHRGDVWETTAYYYQLEPHMPNIPLLSRKDRLPRKEYLITKILVKGLNYGLKFAGFTAIVYLAFQLLNLLNLV
jgi:hypothetical protein